MPHLYPEIIAFSIVTLVPLVLLYRYRGLRAMQRVHIFMFWGCALLSATTVIDYTFHHFWGEIEPQTSQVHFGIVVFGFMPGLALIGYGVLQWARHTSSLAKEVVRRKEAETKLVELTRELEKTAGEALRASRAKTDFLANMSHELRTPLNAIIGFTEVMNAEVFGRLGPPEYKDYLGIIHSSSRQLLDVINDLLDLGKIEKGQFILREEPFDLDSLANECLALCYTEARSKGIKLNGTTESSVELFADIRMIRQVVLNLLSNAVKSTDRRDTIHLSAIRLPSGEAVITIHDTGTGMSEAEIELVTAPFDRGHSMLTRSHEGAVLGLALVKTFVELHQGAMTINSEVGKGTKVCITFPARRVKERPVRRVSVA